MTTSRFSQAKQYIAGGVNSPVRAFKSVGGEPVFFQRAKGPYLWDADAKQYIDYVGSWGAMILGHAHPEVIEAVQKAVTDGLSFGAPTEIETQLAAKICDLIPSVKKVRMVNSGTEATMSALRLARGYTRRNRIVKFEGCYHGHSDSLLVKAGSGALTLGVPTSPGVPDCLAELTHTLPYNDLAMAQQCFDQYGEEIAAIIVEPIAGNMNLIEPHADFLPGLRKLCNQHGSLLIIDEVMTGFRVALGGAQALYDIKADITCYGKVIGGGMPVGAFAGCDEVMSKLAPEGDVYQAGTLSGNPIAMTAGLKTLELIEQANFFDDLTVKVKSFCLGMERAAAAAGVPFKMNGVGGMFGMYFTQEKEIENFAQVMQCNQSHFQSFFHGMLAKGIYLAPSAFEAGFISYAHSENDIADTIDIATEVFQSLEI